MSNLLDQLDKYLTISYLSNPNISLAKIILLFYVIISTDNTKCLLTDNCQNIMNDNRYTYHVISFIKLYIMISLLGNVHHPKYAFIYAIITYIWFLFTTKMNGNYNLIIIMFLFGSLVFEQYIKNKEELVKNDKNLSTTKKNCMMKNFIRMKTFMVLFLIVITLYFTCQYTNGKLVQYGGGFDPIVFLLGNN